MIGSLFHKVGLPCSIADFQADLCTPRCLINGGGGGGGEGEGRGRGGGGVGINAMKSRKILQ